MPIVDAMTLAARQRAENDRRVAELELKRAELVLQLAQARTRNAMLRSLLETYAVRPSPDDPSDVICRCCNAAGDPPPAKFHHKADCILEPHHDDHQ